MTAALRQQDTPASHPGSATSITSNTPSEAYLVGSSIQVNLALQYVAAQSITVQDSEGQTYTYLNSTSDVPNESYLATYVLNNNQYNASFTVTATLGYSTTELNISVQEFSGTNNAGPDVASFPSHFVAPGTGANAISIILSSYQSSGIAMGVMCAVSGSGNLTAGTGFTGGTSFAAGAGFTHSLFETKVITSSGSNNVTFTDATDGGTSTYLGYAVIWDSASTPSAITAAGAAGSSGITALVPSGTLMAAGVSGSGGIAAGSLAGGQKLGAGAGSMGVASLYSAVSPGSIFLIGQSGSAGNALATGVGAITSLSVVGSSGVVYQIGSTPLQAPGVSGTAGAALATGGLPIGSIQAMGFSGSVAGFDLLSQPAPPIIVPPGYGLMPNVVGQYLWEAIQLLQNAGVFNPAAIGYFGTYPISVVWVPLPPEPPVASGPTPASQPFWVIAQSITPNTLVAINAPIILNVWEPDKGVVFP
jgi:hypothetical protein